jgi:glycosyltransferase involved in cell wall biosynthesis
MVELYGLSNVMMLPYQSIEALPYSLTCGDMSLVTLRRGMEGLSVPSKIYSSLAAGLAILAVAGPSSEVADIVEENECGFRVSQGDVDGFVEAVERLYHGRGLLEKMKGQSRACFESNYTRSMSIGRHVQVLRAVAGSSSGTKGAVGANV